MTLDRANFNLAGAYLALFSGNPSAIRELNLTGGANVTFASDSSLTPRTLRVNSTAFGGPQNVNITNATLSLGTNSPSPLHLTVGNRLNVASTSTLNVRFGSDVVVTSDMECDGQVNLSDSGSTLNAGQTIIDGGGSLNVTAGGRVQSSLGTIGRNDSGGFLPGSVTVSGAGSQWNNSGNLFVGDGASGTLSVTGGGSVSSVDGFIGNQSNSIGAVTVTGGTWTMTGRLLVAGRDSSGGIDSGGTGTLNIQPGGTVSVAQGVFLLPEAVVRLQGGTLDASAISYPLGQGSQLQWTSGTLHVGTFNGSLTNTNGSLAPGHSAGSTTINGNFTQVTGGDLEIEIGGPLAGSEFDFVNVTQSAQIGGELDLTLTGGFTPTPAQTFAILISNGLSGAFDNAPSGQRVTTTDGRGSFVVNYGFGSPFDDNQVILSNFLAGFPADFDEDTDVDANDLAFWRGGFGKATGATHLQGDANGDGDADGGDFLVWQQRRGSGLPGGATTAPEPDGLSLVLLIGAALIARSPRRR